MYKTCLHCRYLWLKNRKGRLVFYCRKIFIETGEYFVLSLQVRPKRCPLLKKNKIKKEEKKIKEDNGNNGKVDRNKLNKVREGGKLDITAEIIKLYNTDPVSNNVIRYLLKKQGIIILKMKDSIRLHREEILLNIVRVYKQLWDARGKIMLKAMQTSGKPVRIIMKGRGKDESIEHGKQTQGSGKDGEIKRGNTERQSEENLDKKDSDKT